MGADGGPVGRGLRAGAMPRCPGGDAVDALQGGPRVVWRRSDVRNVRTRAPERRLPGDILGSLQLNEIQIEM